MGGRMGKERRRAFRNVPPQQNLLLAATRRSKYFALLKNRFLLAKCIATGAFSFPTPFLIYFFLTGINAGEVTYLNRLLLILILLLAGALVGVAFYYKDSALTALKDWYPSQKT
jgi:hypothetical protein